MFAIGVLLFFINVIWSLRDGAIAGDNPWDAATLEWSVRSPPPEYNFVVIPTVRSRDPLWEDRLGLPAAQLDARGPGARGGARDPRPHRSMRSSRACCTCRRTRSFPSLSRSSMLVLFYGLLLRAWWLAGAGRARASYIVINVWLWPKASEPLSEEG